METLLLPGMDGTGRLFAPLESQLASDLRARVVAYRPDEPRSYDELLSEIPVPAGEFAIVAESFSGPLGIRLAAQLGARVRALVLVATFVRSPSWLAGWLPLLFGPRLFDGSPPELLLRLGMIGMDARDDQVCALREALRAVAPRVLDGRLRAIHSVDVGADFAGVRLPSCTSAATSVLLADSRSGLAIFYCGTPEPY